jgi:AcrR family transcriptional regulator
MTRSRSTLARGAASSRATSRMAARGTSRGAAGEIGAAVSPSDQLAEIQRSRLLLGALSAIEEFGYGNATVAQITARARVSRRTFYELFDNREECLIALLEDIVERVELQLHAADLADLPWPERVGGGLSVILAFFDREPAFARLCVVESLGGGAQVLARRGQLLTRMAGVLDEARTQGAPRGQCTALTAEALVGAVLGVLHTRLLSARPRPVSELLGELMGVIVLPYLGPAAARREQVRARPATIAPAARRSVLARAERDPLREVPMRLTYRTTRVLECIAARPGVSNREVADRAEVSDQGQISKLLARLERLGLIVNTGEGHARGERNAWRLTPLGRQVARRLALSPHPAEAA